VPKGLRAAGVRILASVSVHAAGGSIRPERLARHLAWFAGVRRDTAGPGEQEAAEYIAGTLREAGVPVHVHEFDAFLSYPIRATLEVLEPERLALPCLTHSFGRSTGPNGIVAELADAADGQIERGAGRAAVVAGLATPVTVLRASRAGCAAVIFTNQDRVIHNMIGTTVWGTPDLDQADRLPQCPAISVDVEGGRTLRTLVSRGAPVRVRIVADVKTEWLRSLLPEAMIPGTGAGGADPDQFALVGAHYCSWNAGITDNATGDACLLEMARMLWEHRGGLARGVRVCWWPGHSHGRYSGSTWYADTRFFDLGERCLAYYNVDSPGVRGATRYVARNTTADIERFAKRIITQTIGVADPPAHRPARAADQSFLPNGVSSFSIYPFLPEDHPDFRPWTGGAANAWWWHTDFDTLDKADTAILATDTRIGVSAIAELVNAPVLPLAPGDTGEEIRAVVSDLRASAGSHLDLAPLIEDADAFIAASRSLDEGRGRAAASPAAARRLNAALLRLARIVNPVLYSRRGRFFHDPAEWSPIMRASGRYVLPGLSPAAGLPALAGTRDYGVLRAQLLRECNRVRAALRDASVLALETVEALAAA
jgi:hypothetical protein